MSDRKARPFAPIAGTRLATIEGVEVVNAGLCVIRFRHEAGADLGGPTTGTAMIARDEWATQYWPPTKGDVIRIVEAPTITLEARPR